MYRCMFHTFTHVYALYTHIQTQKGCMARSRGCHSVSRFWPICCMDHDELPDLLDLGRLLGEFTAVWEAQSLTISFQSVVELLYSTTCHIDFPYQAWCELASVMWAPSDAEWDSSLLYHSIHILIASCDAMESRMSASILAQNVHHVSCIESYLSQWYNLNIMFHHISLGLVTQT